jgi:hypothetical protein
VISRSLTKKVTGDVIFLMKKEGTGRGGSGSSGGMVRAVYCWSLVAALLSGVS